MAGNGMSRYARSAFVWGMRFGLPGLGLRAAARRGDLISRITADPRVRADPFAAYDELRARGPLPRNRIVAATASHAAAVEILRGQEFVAGQEPLESGLLGRLVAAALDPEAGGPVDPPSLLAIDPPQHTRIRKLAARAFSAKAVAAYEGRVTAIADELLDQVEAGDGAAFDLIESYASLLPVTVIAEILGVPVRNRRQFLAWGNDAALLLDPGLTWRQYRRAEASTRALRRWFGQHIARLRTEPGDDLLSQLVHVTEDGDRLTEDELLAMGMLLLVAGFETTVNLIGNGAALLLDHQDQLERLRSGAAGWPAAVEEILRYDSPVQVTLRTARAGTDVAGVAVPAGQPVLVMLGGANRDPDVFDDPHAFDVTRANARDHLAFSSGIHYCIGAQLARLEGAVALRALFERFGDLSLDGSPDRRRTRVLRGYRRLPVTTGRLPLDRSGTTRDYQMPRWGSAPKVMRP